MGKNNTVTAGARISIVDDDQSMREAVNTLIGSMGLTCAQFSSAEDFLASDRSQVIDCLILDIRMPGLSGLELQRRLIADNRAVPIVFITAHYSEAERTRAIKAGAVDFLTKPFTEQELLNAIAASLAIPRKTADRVDEDPH
jgi:FixJ family two-component response regulator